MNQEFHSQLQRSKLKFGSARLENRREDGSDGTLNATERGQAERHEVHS